MSVLTKIKFHVRDTQGNTLYGVVKGNCIGGRVAPIVEGLFQLKCCNQLKMW